MKIVIVLFLLVILASLGSALYYLMRDKGTTDRTVRALTWRVALSITLFLVLIASYKLGWIPAQR